MEIAGHTMGTPNHTLREAIELFASLGFEGIEVICRDDYRCGIPPHTSKEQARRLLKFACSHSVKFACVTPYVTELNSPDLRTRQKEKEKMKQCIRLANSLDCKVVRVYGGTYFTEEGQKSYEEKKKVFVRSMQELGRFAQDINVCLAVENHFNTLTYDAEHTAQVISQINSPAVGILYDQANLRLIGAENYKEAVRIQAPHIVHVHVKDFVFKGQDESFRSSSVTGIRESERIVQFKVTGEGVVPWPAVVKLLKTTGYKSFLSLEYAYWKHPKHLPPPDIGMKKEGHFLRTLLAS